MEEVPGRSRRNDHIDKKKVYNTTIRPPSPCPIERKKHKNQVVTHTLRQCPFFTPEQGMHARRMLGGIVAQVVVTHRGCTVAPVARRTVEPATRCTVVAPVEKCTVAPVKKCTVAPVDGGTVAPMGGKIDKQRAVGPPLEGHLPHPFHWDRR